MKTEALEYLEKASQCEELAEAAPNEQVCAALQNTAAKWRMVAEEVERNEEGEPEEAFSIHATLQADGLYEMVQPSS